MRDEKLLHELLEAEHEIAVLDVLNRRGVLKDSTRWRYLGNMPNNQSIVQSQQSTPAAALVEKFTNGLDAILLRHCKLRGIDPRGPHAPTRMANAIQQFMGDLGDKNA